MKVTRNQIQVPGRQARSESPGNLRLECMELQSVLVALRADNRRIQSAVNPTVAEKLHSDLRSLKQEYYSIELQKNLDKLLVD